jgi:hypothetical protein
VTGKFTPIREETVMVRCQTIIWNYTYGFIVYTVRVPTALIIVYTELSTTTSTSVRVVNYLVFVGNLKPVRARLHVNSMPMPDSRSGEQPRAVRA